MRKIDWALLAVSLAVATAIRIWAPWDDVLGGPRVNFLENDSWYHVRLAENQTRNYPHRVTVDPYAAPDGQYIAVAPLLDTIVATVAVVTQGRDASTASIERIAALTPAVLGVLAVAAAWALATIAFDRRAGFIAGLLAAILPGHFLDRTLVGFVDHHALEVLLSLTTLCFIAYGSAIGAGISLGLYLLSWASGSYFVFILAIWIIATALVAPARRTSAGRFAAIMGAIALAIVLVFQDPGLYRYGTQILALAGLIAVSLIVMGFADHFGRIAGIGVLAAVAILGLAWMVMPGLIRQVIGDINRFLPDATRMGVLEARPLFLYSGNWLWSQPWVFFRSGFYVGLIALAGLMWSTLRSKRVDHSLIVCVTLVHYVATLGQNRFAYYLVPATAVVIAWLATRILDWGGVPHADNPKPKIKRLVPFQRELAVIAIAGLIVAPNIASATIATTRSGGMPQYWFDAMEWLRTNTPEPFPAPDHYHARYQPGASPATYSIMNWWDQGYWIMQTARRVPVSNPTQNAAYTAAAFWTETDAAAAVAMLAPARARYVVADFELPFRDGGGGLLSGRFQTIVEWSGIPTSRYYTLCYSRRSSSEAWRPTWVYREAYYQTMAHRLMVLAGAAVEPSNNTWVVELRNRTDANGRPFCEVANRWQYGRSDEAKQTARQRAAGFEAVGLTPWQPAFSVPAVDGLKVVADFRAPNQKAGESPMIRIFEVARSK